MDKTIRQEWTRALRSGLTEDQQEALTLLNDREECTFPQIADYIEKEL